MRDMKTLVKFGILAAVLAVGVGVARAMVVNSITWQGSTTVNEDAGINGSDAFNTPQNAIGVVCTIATPGSVMNGNVVYSPSLFQQVSNDSTNWVQLDGGWIPPAVVTVSDAGPYQLAGNILPSPFQYSRVQVTPSGAAGLLSCTIARPN